MRRAAESSEADIGTDVGFGTVVDAPTDAAVDLHYMELTARTWVSQHRPLCDTIEFMMGVPSYREASIDIRLHALRETLQAARDKCARLGIRIQNEEAPADQTIEIPVSSLSQ